MIMKWPSFLGCTSQMYYRIFWIFLWLDWGYGFLRGTSQNLSTVSSYHTKSTYYQYDYDYWFSPWSLGRSSISQVFYCKITFFLLSILYSLEESHHEQPPLQSGELCSPSFKVEYRYNLLYRMEFFCMGD